MAYYEIIYEGALVWTVTQKKNIVSIVKVIYDVIKLK